MVNQLRAREGFVAANVVALLFNIVVLAAKLPHAPYRLPVLDVTASVFAVASFSLVVSVGGLVAAYVQRRNGYVAFVVASMVVLVFYVYAVVLCFVQPEALPVVSQKRVSDVKALSMIIIFCVSCTVYCAAALSGRAWTAARLGAMCSFVSLIVACTLAGFGAQLKASQPSKLVVVSSSFEIVDSLLGIPIFLCGWRRLIRMHVVWSTVSLILMTAGAIVAVRSDDYSFTMCHRTSNDCSQRELLMLSALASITCVVSACDIACSAVTIAKEVNQQSKRLSEEFV
jgi:hypothetical protein